MTGSDTRLLKIYCIEEYRMKHGLTAPETIRLFDRYGVFKFLNEPAAMAAHREHRPRRGGLHQGPFLTETWSTNRGLIRAPSEAS